MTAVLFFIRIITSTRKISNGFPPLLSTFKFAWKPTEVKKNTIHTSFKVSSKSISSIPVNQSKYCEYQSADYRCGNTEFFKKRNFSFKESS